ncbi:hypothetical protein PUN28_009010 [Cardiocondyla obscurior]|uniref:Uncharacterized protein n=1 Tax=Cardiocondyla obscurior TaxID=286306 RepID=A0AAW2FV35_9HYME
MPSSVVEKEADRTDSRDGPGLIRRKMRCSRMENEAWQPADEREEKEKKTGETYYVRVTKPRAVRETKV